MKKIEPTKNVTSMPGREVSPTAHAIAATVKQSDPIANRTLIHQARLRGRHHTGSSPRCGRCARGPGRPLRCRRERQLTSVPSGRRSVSRVTNGPGPVRGDALPARGQLEVAAHEGAARRLGRRSIGDRAGIGGGQCTSSGRISRARGRSPPVASARAERARRRPSKPEVRTMSTYEATTATRSRACGGC